ncbi:MAG: EAL domain-containing protein, partial [Rhodospirillales bacterium]|nr:EAL domain-containing protein [Rhodospirillales bacterium]
KKVMSVIVVVDDRVTNRNILAQLARSLEAGAEVFPFDNPKAAFDWMLDQDVDLIITDFQMPDMNGAEFVAECRRKLKCFDVPIIVITAYEDRDYRYSALEAGATDFLRSPIDHHEFRTRAINLLTMWRQKQIIQDRAVSLEHELQAAIDKHADDERQSQERLRNVINTVPALVRASDREGRCAFLNNHHRAYFEVDPIKAIGRPMIEILGAEYGTRQVELDRTVFINGQVIFGQEDRLRDRSGANRRLLTTRAPLRGGGGTVDLVVTVSLDITERVQAEQDVRKLSLAVEQSPASVLITNTNGDIEYVNPKFVEVTGYQPEEVIGKNPRILKSGYTPSENYRELWQTIARGKEWRGEFHNKKKNGELYWEYASVSPITGASGDITHFLAVKEDITVRKNYEEQLLRQANYDDVTKLPNRVLALDRISQALARAHRDRTQVGLLFIDLDRFKDVNDTMGHAAGDRLLREAGERLVECVREGDTVARFGGDEFILILPDLAAPQNAEIVAEKILNDMARPFEIDGQEVFATASIGITIYPLDANDPHALMRNADAAMYRAKEMGRNRVQFFTRELNEQALERVRIESHLRHAIDRGELDLHYQPIADLRTGRLAGAEALLRWHSPEIGTIPPDQFIPLAEDSGLITSLGNWVLNRALTQFGEWAGGSIQLSRMAINVSSRQFRGTSLIDALNQAIASSRISPDKIELEITESLLMEDYPETSQVFDQLTRTGIAFSVDDFGTGYSSLNYLRRFPVKCLKIDRSFIKEVVADPDQAALVKAIINMAHSLNLSVVAEGVETAEQFSFVCDNGCDMVQGFYISEPLTADGFFKLASSWQAPFTRSS